MLKKKKVLLAGNYTCSNRGDLAIVDGLRHGLSELDVDWDINISTTFSEAAEVLLGHSVIKDEISSVFERPQGGLASSLHYNYGDKYLLKRLVDSITSGRPRIPRRFAKASAYLAPYDAIIQVGGSYYIDVYGPYKFLTMALSLALGKPVFMAGHSVGPFHANPLVERLAGKLLPLVRQIHIREAHSLGHLPSVGIPRENARLSADTAWLIPDARPSERLNKELAHIQKPMIALTARNLGIFAKRLGVTQSSYEQNLAALLDIYIGKGYHIIGLSMATDFKMTEYLNDGHVADSIRNRLKNPEGMTVLRAEYDHLEIGAALSRCELLIGTRLHSVILSMRYGTPAIALYYEHKSKGTLEKMGCSDYSFMLDDIGSDSMLELIDHTLVKKQEVQRKIAGAVEQERHLALGMLESIIKEINQM